MSACVQIIECAQIVENDIIPNYLTFDENENYKLYILENNNLQHVYYDELLNDILHIEIHKSNDFNYLISFNIPERYFDYWYILGYKCSGNRIDFNNISTLPMIILRHVSGQVFKVDIIEAFKLMENGDAKTSQFKQFKIC